MGRKTDTITTNTSTTWTMLPSGSGIITGGGTYDGGTLTLEVKDLNGAPVGIEAFTEPFVKVADFPIGVEIRATTTGVGASTDIDLHIWGA